MDFSNLNALIIASNTPCKKDIYLVLDNLGINHFTVPSYEAAKQRMDELVFNLILCESELQDENGFSIYTKLKDNILSKGVVFFMIVPLEEEEAIMIALEMGIDNVVCTPVRKEVFRRKLKNELQKRTRIDLFRTQEFKGYFGQSMMPMLMMEKGKIKKINPAFRRIENDLADLFLGKKIQELFKLEGANNKLAMMRFVNNLSNVCRLENVPLKVRQELRYHLVLIRVQGAMEEQYLVEILPADFNRTGKSPQITNKNTTVSAGEKYNRGISAKLTKREEEIIALSSSGLPIKLIAEQLNLSKRTVEKHRSNIMEKLGASNIIEAIAVLQKENSFSN